jgi:hypothetical protein
MPNLYKKYGVYTISGKKIKNSNKILRPMWAPITERVLDSTVSDFFGILKLNLFIKGKRHWIIRESKKQHLDWAKLWYGGDKENNAI